MKPKTKRNSFRKQMDEYYRMMAEAGQKPYSFVERESQVVYRKNQAPLGRPPSDPVAKKKYDKAKARLTRYARK